MPCTASCNSPASLGMDSASASISRQQAKTHVRVGVGEEVNFQTLDEPAVGVGDEIPHQPVHPRAAAQRALRQLGGRPRNRGRDLLVENVLSCSSMNVEIVQDPFLCRRWSIARDAHAELPHSVETTRQQDRTVLACLGAWADGQRCALGFAPSSSWSPGFGAEGDGEDHPGCDGSRDTWVEFQDPEVEDLEQLVLLQSRSTQFVCLA